MQRAREHPPAQRALAGRIRDAGLHDPEHAAYRTRRTAVGGTAALGIIGGAAGDGGVPEASSACG